MLVQVHTNLPQLEESTGFRKLQPISPAIFWFITYIFDMIIHIITSLCIEIYYTLFDVHSFGIVEYSKFKKNKFKALVQSQIRTRVQHGSGPFWYCMAWPIYHCCTHFVKFVRAQQLCFAFVFFLL